MRIFGLLLGLSFLNSSPHARNVAGQNSVWTAQGVSFSGYFSSHARNEEDIIVSGLLWESLVLFGFSLVLLFFITRAHGFLVL